MEHAVVTASTNQVMAKLFSEIDGKIKQLKGVMFQSDSLRRDLKMLVASQIDQLKDRSEDAVAIQRNDLMRELIHDIEDCIERFLHRITCEQETGLFHKAVYMVKTLGIRNKFAKEMEKLKQRFGALDRGQQSTAARREPPDDFPIENSPVGISEAKKDLLKLLDQGEGDDSKLRVISIVGFGGSGKTTLANAVYGSATAGDTQRYGFHLHAWIRRSQYTDPRGLLMKIVTGFWPASTEADHKDKDKWKLRDYLLENVKEQRYLIVLIDIDMEPYWKWIESSLKDNNKSSRIIVTTSKLSSANTYSGNDHRYVYQMKSLGRVVSEEIAFGNQQNAGDPASRKALVDKCDGHPLALVSVAKHISGEIISSPSRDRCTELCDDLGSFLHAAPPPSKGEDHFVQLRGVLMNNYTSLCYCTVQPSLLYLGIFKNNGCGNLKKKKITRRLVAEGYARSTDPRRNEHEVAEENFKGFIDLNIIQPVGVSSSTCKALGIVHEFVVDKSFTDNFIMPFNVPERRTDNSAHSHQEKVRHLFVSDSTNVPSSGRTLKMDLRRVRSLTVSSESAGGAFSEVSKYRLMRVLDLENCKEVNRRQLRRICRLWNLRYLSLNHSIKKLPRAIDRLKLLETLTVSKNEVTELPVEVLGMPCLIHLTGKFMLPMKLPHEEKLKKLCKENRLQTLAGFISMRNQGFLQLMRHSKNLTKVKIWYESSGEGTDVDKQKLKDAISEYSKERLGDGQVPSLSVDFQTLTECPLAVGIKHYLSSLKLHGNLSKMPRFDTFLSVDKLKELCLSLTVLTPEILSAVSGMIYLVHLKLIADEVSNECQVIEIGKLEWLQRLYFAVTKPDAVKPHWHVTEGNFPRLASLQLLSEQLVGTCGIQITLLPKLQKIELHPEASDLERQPWEIAARSHRNRPKVLPLKPVNDSEAAPTPVASAERVVDVPSMVTVPGVAPAGDVPPDVFVANAVPGPGEDPVTSALLAANVPAKDTVAIASPADDSASSTNPAGDKSLEDPVAVTSSKELAHKDDGSYIGTAQNNLANSSKFPVDIMDQQRTSTFTMVGSSHSSHSYNECPMLAPAQCQNSMVAIFEAAASKRSP